MSSAIYCSHKLLLKSQYLFSRNLIYSSSNNKKYLILFFIINLLIKCCTSTITSDVNAPPSSFTIYMIKSPETTIAPQGDEVQFECELNLEPEKLEWRFRPQDSPNDRDTFINVNRNSGYNVTTKDKLSKLHVYVNQKTVGDYECVAWFGASAITSTSAKLMLATISLDNTKRPIPNQVAHHKISPNNSVIIKCGDVISYPPPIWNYYKDNVPVPATAAQIPSGGLILSQLTKEDSGTYTCSAVNSIIGQEIRMPQKITILVDITPRSSPTFLTKPLNSFTTQPGDTVLLECPGVGNPVPKPVWSRPDGKIDHNRTRVHGYGLIIHDARAEDQGIYNCRLDNGINPVLLLEIHLTVLEFPIIFEEPKDTLTNEKDSLELECMAKGSPPPDIYWMINGQHTKWDPLTKTEGSKLLIRSVEKKHAGIVQCFAKNEMGEASAANQLRVNPKQISGEAGYGAYPLGMVPHTHRSNIDQNSKPTKGRKKNRNPIMIPPSRPNVTRLSDESVMVRWSVPQNDGLPIQFFKVQHRLLGDTSKKVGRSHWKTANEDIPPNVRSYLIDNLKPDHFYRFRIAAVYSNNDNKLSQTSGKFHLLKASQLGPGRSHLPPANLTHIETLSETELIIHWIFTAHQPVEGFYVYYRASTSAGEYNKATVEGSDVRQYQVDNLEPGTSYEFKIQSFTSSTASEFSAIVTGRTRKIVTSTQVIPSVIATKEMSSANTTIPITVGGILGVTVLSLAIFIGCIAFKKRKLTREDENENKTHPDHIQVEANGFAGGGRVMSSPIHKGSRLNGVIPRMNITANPLAQDEKNDKIIQQTSNLPALITPPTLGIPTIPNHHNSLHHQSTPPGNTALPPHPHRRTLERNIRNNNNNNNVQQQNNVNHNNVHQKHHNNNNLNQNYHPPAHHQNHQNHHKNINHHSNHSNNSNHSNHSNHSNNKNSNHHPNNNHIHHNNKNHNNFNNQHNSHDYNHSSNNHHQHSNGHIDSTAMMLDGDCGLPIVRSASIRRQPRRGSNNSVNGSPRITRGPSAEILHHRPHYQHSPMPIRSSKRAARRVENIEVSSGSLNSIEV